jgi:inosine triphosphate pyrophosphatase
MFMARVVTLVTGNAGKLREFQEVLGGHVDLKSSDIDLPELQGEIHEILIGKYNLAREKVSGPIVIEDTSLCFNALNGLPGPYVKWFLTKVGHEGLNNLLAAYDDKSAAAVCALAYGEEGKEPKIFIGKTTGKIVPARGSKNFGWDPIFQPDGFDLTYAEMDSNLKNEISHRRRAIQQLLSYFQENN